MTIPPLTMSSNDRLKGQLAQILRRAFVAKIASRLSLFVGFGLKKSPLDIVIHHGEDGLYDVASLTKICGTTLALAKAISLGRTALETEPFSCWPGITIKMLLAHRAGLPAHRKIYDELKLGSKDFIRNQALAFDYLMAQPTKPGSEKLYSDLGFIALGFYLERIAQKPLTEIFQNAWSFFGVKPLVWFPSKPSTFMGRLSAVPTGFCPDRKQWLCAQVHDTNCYYLGGLAGHAGLFSTLDAISSMGRFFLATVKQRALYSQELITQFARLGLGFDKPNTKGTNNNLSPDSFGHFGYTGTSLWIDPKAFNNLGVIIALLTNRIASEQQPDGIFWLRRAINRTLLGR